MGVLCVTGRTSGLASVGHGVGKVTEMGSKMNAVTLLPTSTTDHVFATWVVHFFSAPGNQRVHASRATWHTDARAWDLPGSYTHTLG